jgi:hypothetical protein
MEKTKTMPAPQRAMNEEELKNTLIQVTQQNDMLKKKLQELMQQLNQQNVQMTFARLEFLFKILDKASFFTEEVTETAAKEIIEIMYPPKEEETKE